MTHRWVALLSTSLVAPALVGVAGSQTVAAPEPASAMTEDKAKIHPKRAVISSRVIGHTLKDRPIRAFELGQRRARLTVVALGAMHGNEQAGTVVLRDLRDGRRIRGVHLWVIPVHNVDGAKRHERHNARGVDLNRNFPKKWKRLTGWYYSGRRPASEPETRGLMRFLNRVEPDYVVSLHQPLYGIDAYDAKDPRRAHRLANKLNLPVKEFACGGVCHGTLTQWFNARHDGAAITAEFGDSPRWRYLHVRAPRGLLRAFGGRFG